MIGSQIRKHRVQRRRRGGFTLMEVLLVLVILVVLASMAVTVFSGTQAQAEKRAAAAQVGIFKSAVTMYKFDTKDFPDNLESLVTRPGDAKLADRWAGPYIDKVPKDPWDNDYRFAAPGKHNPEGFDIWSTGPDGSDGTEDDIGNWEA
jgi:general secretion pathway protein G